MGRTWEDVRGGGEWPGDNSGVEAVARAARGGGLRGLSQGNEKIVAFFLAWGNGGDSLRGRFRLPPLALRSLVGRISLSMISGATHHGKY